MNIKKLGKLAKLAILSLILLSTVSFASTTAVLLDFLAVGGSVKANGQPNSQGKVYFYTSSTATTLKSVYQDYQKQKPFSQPVILDTSGCAKVYADGMYFIKILDKDSAIVKTLDNANFIPVTVVTINYAATADYALDSALLGGKAEANLSVATSSYSLTANYSNNSGLLGGKLETNLSVNTANNLVGNIYDTAGNIVFRTATASAYNVFIGKDAGFANDTGLRSVMIGDAAGAKNTAGNDNVFVGTFAGNTNTLGKENTFIGPASGYYATTGNYNVAIGSYTGTYQSDGSTPLTPTESIYIGHKAYGKDNNDKNSIVIGNRVAGLGPNTTVIGNSETTLTQLYGTVSANIFTGTFNGNVPTATYVSSPTQSVITSVGVLKNLYTSGPVYNSHTAPYYINTATADPANSQIWADSVLSQTKQFQIWDDTTAIARNYLKVTRGTTNVTAMEYGNATNLPSHTFYGKIFDGSTASSTDFPKANIISSTGDTGHTYPHNIGMVGETVAVDGAGETATGVGGVAATNGQGTARGVVGVGKVTSTNDTGASVGVWGRAIDTHIGDSNIAVFATAKNGLTNYSFYGISGNIYNYDSAQIDGGATLGTANNTNFDNAGFMVATGNAMGWDDIAYQNINSVKDTGTGSLVLTVITGNAKGWAFSLNDEVPINVEMSHRWKILTETSHHIHVFTTGTNTTTRNIQFSYDYSYSDINGDITTPVTVTKNLEIPANTKQGYHFYLELLDGGHIPSLTKVSGHVMGAIKRVATSIGSEPSWDPVVASFGIHGRVNRLGSRTEYAD